MKKALLSLVVLLPIIAISQDLVVAAGQTKTLIASERTLNLRKLTLGDNAIIVIPATMDGWTVTADDVSIGNNVRIVANNPAGTPGNNGTNGINASQKCKAGVNGIPGGMGLDGQNGKLILLTFKIRVFGSLQVDVGGGRGGSGGIGGRGGNGGAAKCEIGSTTNCRGGNGGSGGKGGAGGRGGAGGNVTIRYKKLGNVNIDVAKFIINNLGGIGGAGGMGAAGGMGGSSATCPVSSPQPAGQNGLTGIKGAVGLNGATGVKSVTTF